jgi:hypothetical protein
MSNNRRQIRLFHGAGQATNSPLRNAFLQFWQSHSVICAANKMANLSEDVKVSNAISHNNKSLF